MRTATTATAPTKPATSSANPSAEQVARRAYEIWNSEGKPGGCALEHWLRAERELREPPDARQSRTSRRTGGGSTGGVSRNAEWCPW